MEPVARYPHGDLRGLRVLIVDDDATARSIVQRALEYAGAFVQTADRATAAPRHVKELQFDVAVCDMTMPGHDGRRFVRQLRALPSARGGRLPVIGVGTALGVGDGAAAALESGCHGYLSKPFSPWKRCRAILAVAEAGRRAADEVP